MIYIKKKKSIRKKSSSYRSSADDKSFLIIAGGGFVLIILIFMIFGSNRGIFGRTYNKLNSVYAQMKADHTVVIKQYSFFPKEIRIKVGDRVMWKNEDAVDHSPRGVSRDFSAGKIYSGGYGYYKFDQAGEYEYYSGTYPSVRGKIIVE